MIKAAATWWILPSLRVLQYNSFFAHSSFLIYKPQASFEFNQLFSICSSILIYRSTKATQNARSPCFSRVTCQGLNSKHWHRNPHFSLLAASRTYASLWSNLHTTNPAGMNFFVMRPIELSPYMADDRVETYPWPHRLQSLFKPSTIENGHVIKFSAMPKRSRMTCPCSLAHQAVVSHNAWPRSAEIPGNRATWKWDFIRLTLSELFQ